MSENPAWAPTAHYCPVTVWPSAWPAVHKSGVNVRAFLARAGKEVNSVAKKDIVDLVVRRRDAAHQH